MIQERGYARFHDSDIDARLKAIWDAYTWEIIPDHQGPFHVLNIQYVKLI